MGKKSPGFILIGSLVLSLLLLSLLGIWYKQTILQAHLAKRVIEDKLILIECNSLLPIIKDKFSTLSEEELLVKGSNFLIIRDDEKTRWKIDRLPVKNGMISIIFNFQNEDIEPLVFRLKYEPKS